MAQRMSDEQLLAYIKAKKTFCYACANLKKQVMEKGLKAIDEYDGMICSGVEYMFIRRGRY